jgi:hypothetical protein
MTGGGGDIGIDWMSPQQPQQQPHHHAPHVAGQASPSLGNVACGTLDEEGGGFGAGISNESVQAGLLQLHHHVVTSNRGAGAGAGAGAGRHGRSASSSSLPFDVDGLGSYYSEDDDDDDHDDDGASTTSTETTATTASAASAGTINNKGSSTPTMPPRISKGSAAVVAAAAAAAGAAAGAGAKTRLPAAAKVEVVGRVALTPGCQFVYMEQGTY